MVEHQGDVVLVTAGRGQPRHQLIGEVLKQGPAALAHRRSCRGHAIGDRPPPALHQAVGIQQQRRAWWQDVRGLGPPGILADCQRERAPAFEPDHAAVGVHDDAGRVSGT